MSTTTDDSLAVRVSRVIGDEQLRALERCEREPHAGMSKATKRESDMRAWGMTYGIAFGLLLAADPGGDLDTLAEDALDAARASFGRWSGYITRRQAFGAAIDDTLLAYQAMDIECERALADNESGRMFTDKMQGLIETIGMPERGVID
jgi:hypothetical protein